MPKSKIPADVKQRLAELSHNGCVVTVTFTDGSSLHQCPCVIWATGRRVCWAQMMPQDQHHCHAPDVEFAKVVNDGRDVLWIDSEGQLFRVTPIEIWQGRGEELGIGSELGLWRTGWAQWLEVRDDPKRRAKFYGWIANCMGVKPPK